jgi:hypothetical protein
MDQLFGQFLYVTIFVLTKFIRSIFISYKIYTVPKFIRFKIYTVQNLYSSTSKFIQLRIYMVQNSYGQFLYITNFIQ